MMKLEMCLEFHHDFVTLVVGTSAWQCSFRLQSAHRAGNVTKKHMSSIMMTHVIILTRPQPSWGLHNGVDGAQWWSCTVMMKVELHFDFHHGWVTLVVGTAAWLCGSVRAP